MIHMSRGRRQSGAVAGLAATAAFLIAACTGTAHHPGEGNPQAGPVPHVAPSGAGRPSPLSRPARRVQSASQPASPSAQPVTSQPPPAPPTVPPVPPCGTGDLRGSFGAGSGAAGTFYYPVQFTNTSGSACTLFGYPGVFVVTGPSGSQIGNGAVRIGTFSPQLVTIAAGGTAHATLQMPDPGVLGPEVCVPMTVQWLRVYPPGQFTSLSISVPAAPNPVQICTGKHLGNTIPLGVFVVMPGSTGT